jgi:hypothetical protein
MSDLPDIPTVIPDSVLLGLEASLEPATPLMRWFVNQTRTYQDQKSATLLREVLRDAASHPKGYLSKTVALAAITDGIARAEQGLAAICSQHALEFLLPLIRVLTGVLSDWEGEWIAYATLAIIKWSNRDHETALGPIRTESGFCIMAPVSTDHLDDCCTIATLSRVLGELNGLCRWLGKGATIVHQGNGQLAFEASTPVTDAVKHYERRRPGHWLLADTGIWSHPKLPTPIEFAANPLLRLGKPKPPFDRLTLTSAGEQFPITYCLAPYTIGRENLLRVTRPYDDALVDLFKLSSDQILSVLDALSWLVLVTIPEPNEERWPAIEFNSRLSDPDFKHRFSFMLNLYRKAYVKFPREYLHNALVRGLIARGSDSVHAASLVDTFLTAFCVAEADCTSLNVRALDVLPLLYATRGNEYCVDMLWIGEFIQTLVLRGKDWFSAQHGDRFTLTVKRTLEGDAPAATIVAWKHIYRARTGTRAEVDLLVYKNDVLYAIECKAFAKSRDHWMGKPDAIRLRAHQIADAVEQARRTAKVIAAICKSTPDEFPPVTKVEWVLCLPTQEFLSPLGKFGLLATDIPRVCTPEELVTVLG